MEESVDFNQFFDFDAFFSTSDDVLKAYHTPKSLRSELDEASCKTWLRLAGTILGDFSAYYNETEAVTHEEAGGTTLPKDQEETPISIKSVPKGIIRSPQDHHIIPPCSGNAQKHKDEPSSTTIHRALYSGSQASEPQPQKRLRICAISESMEVEKASSKLSPSSSICNFSDSRQFEGSHDDVAEIS